MAFLWDILKKKTQEARATPSQKIILLYQSNRMFLWIFWSYIDSCRDTFLSTVTLNVPTSHGSQVVGPEKSLIWYDPPKESGFVLGWVSSLCQQGVLAECLMCPSVSLAKRVRFLLPLHFTSFLLPRRRHYKTPPNTANERLLGGRVVSVATLPLMVLRLGWGSRFQFDPRLSAAGRLMKLWWVLGIWPDEYHLASHGTAEKTYPAYLWRTTRQEVAPGYIPSRSIWKVKQALVACECNHMWKRGRFFF